jgi:protein-tyrosine phosphatase
MIDIHCHILPGLDDGAKDLEESLAMARQAYLDGIRHIIATPHYNDKFRVTRSTVLQAVADFQQELDKNGLDLRIYPGSEVRMESSEAFEAQLRQGDFCFLNENPQYILLEQHWHGYVEETPDVVRRMAAQGTIIIVPHPERHIFFRDRPELLDELLELGAWTQISVDSMLGNNGEDAKQFAFRLLDEGKLHTIATDAHSTSRKPNLSEGFTLIKQRKGEAAAQAIYDRIATILR